MLIKKLYKYRFEIFFASQIIVLFGSILFPPSLFEETLLPFIFLLNISAGILMIYKKTVLMWFSVILFTVALFIFGSDMITRSANTENLLTRISVYFVFYIIVTWNIIRQVWKAKQVTKNVVVGLMSGYISLGFLGFFLFMSIELTNPGAFGGEIIEVADPRIRSDGLLYYAFITLLTIGYGEIVPAIPVAQKAAILVGLAGQFYLVIITAVIVGKYMRHLTRHDK